MATYIHKFTARQIADAKATIRTNVRDLVAMKQFAVTVAETWPAIQAATMARGYEEHTVWDSFKWGIILGFEEGFQITEWRNATIKKVQEIVCNDLHDNLKYLTEQIPDIHERIETEKAIMQYVAGYIFRGEPRYEY